MVRLQPFRHKTISRQSTLFEKRETLYLKANKKFGRDMLQKMVIEPKVFPFYDYRRYSLSLALKKVDYLFMAGHTASQYNPDLKKIVCTGDMITQAHVA